MNQELKVWCNLYNSKNKHGGGGCRCEPRIEGIVKLKNGWGSGVANLNKELKV